jgi:hypothetical protein
MLMCVTSVIGKSGIVFCGIFVSQQARGLQMSKEDVIEKFNDELWRKLKIIGEGALDGLDPLEYDAVCLMNFQANVFNGALHAYYSNTSGDFAMDMPDMMRRIGALQVADLLDEANSLFGPDGPHRDQMKRASQMDQWSDQEEEKIDELSSRFFKAEDQGVCVGDLFDEFVFSQKTETGY